MDISEIEKEIEEKEKRHILEILPILIKRDPKFREKVYALLAKICGDTKKRSLSNK